MKRALVVLGSLILAGCIMASAGSLSGVVKGGGAAIVYLEPAAPSTAPATAQQPYVITQKAMKFVPTVLAVPVGATVIFKNEDSPVHNVSWPSVGGDKRWAHNLGNFPRGEQRSYKFEHAGIVPLACELHPDMEGYIIVSPTPYYGRTEPVLGIYQIAECPTASTR